MVAEFSFKILTYTGFWRPQSLTSKWSIRIYNICSLFMLTYKQFYALSFIIFLFQNIENKEFLFQNIFLSSSISLTTFKVTYVNVYRKEITSFTNMFLDEKCSPRNKNEKNIYETLIEKERYYLIKYIRIFFLLIISYNL